jgi:hypothetical protein
MLNIVMLSVVMLNVVVPSLEIITSNVLLVTSIMANWARSLIIVNRFYNIIENHYFSAKILCQYKKYHTCR